MKKQNILVVPIVGTLYLCLSVAIITAKVHTVAPGRLYRSRQMKEIALTHAIKTYNIKTIVNLRGTNENEKWWKKEHEIAKKHNVTIHDIALSARKLPSHAQITQLTEIFRNNTSNPILIHCNRGCDRTSVACALYQFEHALANNIPIIKAKKLAKKQLSTLRYGHWKLFFPAVDAFVKMWIALRDKHRSLPLALKHYNPCEQKNYDVS